MRELLWMFLGRNETLTQWVSAIVGKGSNSKKQAKKTPKTMEEICRGMGL
jgi:hypothetical protein